MLTQIKKGLNLPFNMDSFLTLLSEVEAIRISEFIIKDKNQKLLNFFS